jgi:hypothetical protein
MKAVGCSRETFHLVAYHRGFGEAEGGTECE